MQSKIYRVNSLEEASKLMKKRAGVIELIWCGSDKCGHELEMRINASLLGIPADIKEIVKGKCIICNRKDCQCKTPIKIRQLNRVPLARGWSATQKRGWAMFMGRRNLSWRFREFRYARDIQTIKDESIIVKRGPLNLFHSTFDPPEADKCLLAYGELDVRCSMFILSSPFWAKPTPCLRP